MSLSLAYRQLEWLEFIRPGPFDHIHVLLSGGYGHAHGADAFNVGLGRVAGLNLTYPFRRAGEEHVAGAHRIEARRPFDQRRHTQYQITRVRGLPRARLAVDCQRERQRARVGQLVGRHEPRAEHRIGVRRLAHASVLGAADRDVETDAITGDELERPVRLHVLRLAADDHGEL